MALKIDQQCIIVAFLQFGDIDFLPLKDIHSLSLASKNWQRITNEWAQAIFPQLNAELRQKIDNSICNDGRPHFNALDRELLAREFDEKRFEGLFKRNLGIVVITKMRAIAKYEDYACAVLKTPRVKFDLAMLLPPGAYNSANFQGPPGGPRQVFFQVLTPEGNLVRFLPFPAEEFEHGSRIELGRKLVKQSQEAITAYRHHRPMLNQSDGKCTIS